MSSQSTNHFRPQGGEDDVWRDRSAFQQLRCGDHRRSGSGVNAEAFAKRHHEGRRFSGSMAGAVGPVSWSSRPTIGIGWSTDCRTRAIMCTSPTPRRSSSTKDLSIAAMRPMRSIWPTCCDWVSCRRARSCRVSSGRCAIWRASACNWCNRARPHVLAVENIMARQLGRRMTSNQIKRLTGDTIDSLPVAADVGLAIKATSQ